MSEHNDVRVVERLLTTDTVRRAVVSVLGQKYTVVVFRRADGDWQLDLLPTGDRRGPVLRISAAELRGNDVALAAEDYEAMLLALVGNHAELLGDAGANDEQ